MSREMKHSGIEWIGLQADYNMQRAKQDKSFMKRLENIRKIAAIF